MVISSFTGRYGFGGISWQQYSTSLSARTISSAAMELVSSASASASSQAQAHSQMSTSGAGAGKIPAVYQAHSDYSIIPRYLPGGDPAELAVRSRIQYIDPDQAPEAVVSESDQAKSPADTVKEAECQTCEERKYQDGSDDPGVSYKMPTKISPERAATAVRSHEMEHVRRERDKAEQEDRKVVQQSVSLHTSICPECGKVYISGGVTRTTTASDQSEEKLEAAQAQQMGFEAVA